MISDYDIRLCQRWVHLAKVFGSTRIHIKLGDDPNTWVVTVEGPTRPDKKTP